jgi:alkanesulfonate monooxygenase SsuD/methylene tetrahydromethanopterin reductase-like flavin-dependent oxidoreductase (luciferase family)
MRIGVMVLPEMRWRESVHVWRAVEDMGFDAGWSYDHLWWRSLSDGPWFDTFSVLSAAACATKNIRLGTLVTSPNFRHPVVTAKNAIAIDDISEGRFTLGVGAGSAGAGDSYAIGGDHLSPGSRAARFAEFVELIDLLLSNPVTTYRGHFFSAFEARMIPGCVQQPRLPLAVAATGWKSMTLAARHADSWVTCGPLDLTSHYSPAEFLASVRQQAGQFTRACDQAGRDPESIGRILVTTEKAGNILESAGSLLRYARLCADAGITELVINWPRRAGIYAGDPARLREIADKALPEIRQF